MDEDRKRMNAKSMDEEYDDEFDEGRVRTIKMLFRKSTKWETYCYNEYNLCISCTFLDKESETISITAKRL